MNMNFIYRVQVQFLTQVLKSDNNSEVFCEAMSAKEAELTAIVYFQSQRKVMVKEAIAYLAMNQNKRSYANGLLIN